MLMINAKQLSATWVQKVFRRECQLIILFALTISGCTGLISNSPSQPSPLAVTITSPSSGATVSGKVKIVATASGSAAVASVQFRVDGASVGAAVASAPYSQSLDTTKLINGKHDLTAIAVDNSGNKTTSAVVSIATNNLGTPPPTVSITSPASGATVSGTITIVATASGSAAVASVQFRVDGASVGAAVAAAPYSQSLDTTKLINGKHDLTAIAVDNSGNKTTSAVVSIT